MAGSGLSLAAPDIRPKFPQDYRDPLKPFAPSILAAYTISLSIWVIAAKYRMKVTPVHSQTVIAMMTGSAVLDWASQGCASEPSPMSDKTVLNWPVAEKICRKIGAIVAGASTTGTKMITLYRFGSLTFECSRAANVKPTVVCTVNVTTKQLTVCRIVSQTTGSS